MTFYNLISGLIGALLGCGASLLIAWWLALSAARDTLRGRLMALKDYRIMGVGGNEVSCQDKFVESYADILAATFAYRQWLFPALRGKIDEALYYYRGGKKHDILKRNAAIIKYAPIPVWNNLDLEQRVDKMLEAIERID